LGDDRGAAVAVYAIARTKDNAVYREVMSVGEVEKIRRASRAANAGPWVDHWGEMARKTVIKRLAKRLPSSTDLDQVIASDNEAIGMTNEVTGSPTIDSVKQEAPAALVAEESPTSRLKRSIGKRAKREEQEVVAEEPAPEVAQAEQETTSTEEATNESAADAHF
jgi:recombination protein RecT